MFSHGTVHGTSLPPLPVERSASRPTQTAITDWNTEVYEQLSNEGEVAFLGHEPVPQEWKEVSAELQEC